MRGMLHCVHLGPEYWCWAMLHVVNLNNRLPHQTIGTTPYEAYTGQRPNLKRLHIFGSPIIARLPGKCPPKLDTHAVKGIFLGYTATMNNIYYMDIHTSEVKITTHVVFDEAGYTIPPSERTLIQQNLQNHGQGNDLQQDLSQQDIIMSEAPTHPTSATDTNANTMADTETDTVSPQSPPTLHVQKLPHATLPTRVTEEAAGYDLYSAAMLTIPANQMASISTGLAIRPPHGTYCQIFPRSGLIKHFGVEPKAGVIEPDYTRDITILMSNTTDKPYTIHIGDRIAQKHRW